MAKQEHDAIIDRISRILAEKGFKREEVKGIMKIKFKPDLLMSKNDEVLRVEYESLSPTVDKLQYWQKQNISMDIGITKFIVVIPDLFRYVNEVWIMATDFFKGKIVIPLKIERIKEIE